MSPKRILLQTKMSDYLQQIENAYSRGRGKTSRLSPLDWQLAARWETEGVPLPVALRAIDEGFASHRKANKGGQINTLRYFEKLVDQHFGDWVKNQIGKSGESAENPVQFSAADKVKNLAAIYAGRADLPEPLQSAITELARDLRELLAAAESDPGMSPVTIDERLQEMATGLEIPMALSVPDDERARIVIDVVKEFGTLDDETRSNICIQRLYKKFNLPKLSVFE